MKKVLFCLLFPFMVFSQTVEVHTKSPDVAVKETNWPVEVTFYRSSGATDLTINYTITKNTANGSVLDTSSGTITFPNDDANINLFIGYVSGTGDDTYTVTVTSGAGYTIGSDSSDTFEAVEFEPTLAFPGAVGPGSYVSGGRGGTTLIVDRLAWDDSPGSLKWALEQTYPRTIVFEVSGHIVVPDSFYTVSGSQYGDLTIAGQTAPDGGIRIITQNKFGILNMENVIIRGVSFLYHTGSYQSLDVSGINGLVIDHCDFKYAENSVLLLATDNNNKYGQGNVTVMNSLFAESGSTGVLSGSASNVSSTRGHKSGRNGFYLNYFYNISHRFPNVLVRDVGHEIVNNVIYNWAARLSSFYLKPVNARHENNYYKHGPRTNAWTSGSWTTGNNHQVNSGVWSEGGTIYTNGNIYDGFVDDTYSSDNDASAIWAETFSVSVDPSLFITATVPDPMGHPVTMLTAAQAFDSVMVKVGNRVSLNADGSTTSIWSSMEQNYISDAQNATMTYGTTSAFRSPAGFTYPSSDYPETQNTRAASYDTDNDGMPDTWETATFGNLSRDGTGDFNSDGYTDLEEFLNLIDTGAATGTIAVTNLQWDNPNQTVNEGGFLDLSVTWTPSNATDQGFSLLSSNTSVVSNAGAIVGEGTATLTITADDTTNGTISDVMNVTVNAIQPQKVIRTRGGLIKINGSWVKIKSN